LWGIYLDALRRKMMHGSARAGLTHEIIEERRRSGDYDALHTVDPMHRESLAFGRGERLRGTQLVEVFDGGIAVMTVSGPIMRRASAMDMDSGIMSTETIARDLMITRKSQNVAGLICDWDTPGGEAAGGDELAAKFYETRSIIPVESYAEGLCASLGYYLASGTQKITVGRMGLLGSIGVVMGIPAPAGKTKQGDNVQEDGFGGIYVEFVSSQSPKKRQDPTTKEGHDYYQMLVNECADVFVADVAKYRNIPVEKLPEQYGEGGVYPGRVAQTMGLADEVGSFESVLQRMQTTYGKASRDKVAVPANLAEDDGQSEQERATEATTADDPVLLDSTGEGGSDDMGRILDKVSAALNGGSSSKPNATKPTEDAGQGGYTLETALAELNKRRASLEAQYEDKAVLRATQLVTGSAMPPAVQADLSFEYLTAYVDDALYGGTVLFVTRATDGSLVETEGTRYEQLEAKYAVMPKHTLAEERVRSVREGRAVDPVVLDESRSQQAAALHEAGDYGDDTISKDDALASSPHGQRVIQGRTNNGNGAAAR
jgi:ClpP class serine protease